MTSTSLLHKLLWANTYFRYNGYVAHFAIITLYNFGNGGILLRVEMGINLWVYAES